MFFSANQNQYRIRSISSIRVPLLKFHQRMSCHGFGLFEPHQVEDRRGYVGQDTVADRFHAVGNHDDRHRIERMSRIGRAVGIDRIIGVAVIGDLHGPPRRLWPHTHRQPSPLSRSPHKLPYAPPYRRWRNSGR